MGVKVSPFERISIRSMARVVSMCGGEEVCPDWWAGGLAAEGLLLVEGVDILCEVFRFNKY